MRLNFVTKTLAVAVLLQFSNTSVHAEQVKECKAILPNLEGGLPSIMKITINKSGDKLTAQTVHVVANESNLKEQEKTPKKLLTSTIQPEAKSDYINVRDDLAVDVLAGDVRHNLHLITQNEIKTLNAAEHLIFQAMYFESNPVTQKISNSGLDLTKVKSIRAFIVDKQEGDSGLAAIIEAKDASGKDLGTFFGGFFITPCI